MDHGSSWGFHMTSFPSPSGYPLQSHAAPSHHSATFSYSEYARWSPREERREGKGEKEERREKKERREEERKKREGKRKRERKGKNLNKGKRGKGILTGDGPPFSPSAATGPSTPLPLPAYKRRVQSPLRPIFYLPMQFIYL